MCTEKSSKTGAKSHPGRADLWAEDGCERAHMPCEGPLDPHKIGECQDMRNDCSRRGRWRRRRKTRTLLERLAPPPLAGQTLQEPAKHVFAQRGGAPNCSLERARGLSRQVSRLDARCGLWRRCLSEGPNRRTRGSSQRIAESQVSRLCAGIGENEVQE